MALDRNDRQTITSGSTASTNSTRRRTPQLWQYLQRNNRSLKLLFIAAVTYAISIQFKSAFRTIESPQSRHENVDFEPPGSRRWGASSGVDQRRDNTTQQHHVLDAIPDDKQTGLAKAPNEGIEDPKDTPQEQDNLELEDRTLLNSVRGASQNNDSENAPAKTKNQISPSRRIPRTVAIHYDNVTFSIVPLKNSSNYKNFYSTVSQYANVSLSVMPLKLNDTATTNLKEDCMPTNGPKVQPDWYDPNALDFIDGYDWKVCEPMYDWQSKSYPNCNKFHELDLRSMRVINTGGSRIALEMRQQLDGKENKFVYKTVKYHKEMTMKLVEEQRKDSLIMERTSSSQFIPDIHGYCSLGVMMDFMPEGNMHEYIKGVRLAGKNTLRPVDRLRLSIHIATSVADLHTIDGTPMPSVFHNDPTFYSYISQSLFQNGVFKLNDFNYARPIYKNKETNEQCTRTQFGMGMWKARSLEEMQHKLGHADRGPVKPDKIDVWMMGNIIWIMMTDLYTFEKPKNLSWKQSGAELVAGRRTKYPPHIVKTKNPAHLAMKKALDMCWTQNWKERPSARSISDYLIGELKKITGEENPDLRVVLPKRDPKQRNTESDYEYYND
ncbi:hypothetical protein ACHAXR_007695 [Thalassiosira sp. AJA248-18]